MIIRCQLLHELLDPERLVTLVFHLSLDVLYKFFVEVLPHACADLVEETRKLHQTKSHAKISDVTDACACHRLDDFLTVAKLEEDEEHLSLWFS